MSTRIRAITDAATLLFLRQGYARTQISHIAKAIGVSVGTIYHDFMGKKEIMHFVLKCTVDPDFADQDFERPVTDELFAGLEQEIVSALEQNAADFAAKLERDISERSLESLVSDAFDVLVRYAVGCLFVEKNQFDFPFLAKHYRIYRGTFFSAMSQTIAALIQNGTMRPVKDVKLTTTQIIETLTWWAMDQRYTSFETLNVPLETAKEVCMDNILSAYQA